MVSTPRVVTCSCAIEGSTQLPDAYSIRRSWPTGTKYGVAGLLATSLKDTGVPPECLRNGRSEGCGIAQTDSRRRYRWVRDGDRKRCVDNIHAQAAGWACGWASLRHSLTADQECARDGESVCDDACI